MERSDIQHDPRHLGVPSGASKMISEPMVCLAQTVRLSYVKISTISKWIETSFHLSLVTKDDEDINTDHTSTPSTSTPTPTGPISRARARKLNHQVSSFLSSCPSCLDLGDTCTLVLIRNQGEDRKGKGLA